MEKEEHVRIELEQEMVENAGSGWPDPGHKPDNVKREDDH